MYSKGIFHLTITILCMIIFIHYAKSQPVSVDSQENDDILITPTSESESNDDSIPQYYFLHSEYNDINQPNSSEPVRRANFWKRANFWRKRANFWRRDILP